MAIETNHVADDAAAASKEEESRRLLEAELERSRRSVVSVMASGQAMAAEARRRVLTWLRRLLSPHHLHPLTDFRLEWTRWDVRAMNRETLLHCRELYYAKLSDDEYEPAPGEVTRRRKMDNYGFSASGSFVVRRKRSGCYSFLPPRRTRLFFEYVDTGCGYEVFTWTPLVFSADCVCRTYYHQCHVPHVSLMRKCACGDSKVERTCNISYIDANVLHPFQGGFPFGPDQSSKCFVSYYRGVSPASSESL